MENGQHAQDCVTFEERPCVTLIAATSTQRGDTGDEHDGHGTESSNIAPDISGVKIVREFSRCQQTNDRFQNGDNMFFFFAKKNACVPLCLMRGSVCISVSQPSEALHG